MKTKEWCVVCGMPLHKLNPGDICSLCDEERQAKIDLVIKEIENFPLKKEGLL